MPAQQADKDLTKSCGCDVLGTYLHDAGLAGSRIGQNGAEIQVISRTGQGSHTTNHQRSALTLEADEGPARIEQLLASGAPVRRSPVDSADFRGLDALVTADGDLRTLPCHLAEAGGMDGFYAARLTRRD